LLPVGLGLVLVAPAFAWAAIDKSVWPWDPSWYGEVSVDLWSVLRLGNASWLGAMQAAFGAKPPAIAWLGQFFVPLGTVVGYSTALLASVVLCEAGVVASVYVAVRRLTRGSRLPSLAAAIVAAAAPLFVSMGHEYFVEPLQALSVAWMVVVMVSAADARVASTAAQLCGAVSLGLLAKLSTPLYMAAPACVTVGLAAIVARRSPKRETRWFRDVRVLAHTIVAIVLTAGAAGWYAKNARAAYDHADLANSGTLYGKPGHFVPKFGDWLGRLRDMVFLPHLAWVLALVGAGLAVAALKRPGMPGRITRLGIACVGASLASIVLVLAVLARSPNEEVRYLLPLLPLIAVSLGYVLHVARSPALTLAVAAVALTQLVVLDAQSFGSLQSSTFSYSYLRPAQRDDTLLVALRRVVDESCTPAANQKINIVGVDLPWLNSNTLSLLADERFALRGRQCQYTALGYAEVDPGKAWERVLSFQPPYYVGVDYGNRANQIDATIGEVVSAGDPFNVVNVAVLGRVRRSTGFRVVPGSRAAGLVVFERKPTG
jgi:hypothetical protein